MITCFLLWSSCCDDGEYKLQHLEIDDCAMLMLIIVGMLTTTHTQWFFWGYASYYDHEVNESTIPFCLNSHLWLCLYSLVHIISYIIPVIILDFNMLTIIELNDILRRGLGELRALH